MPNAQTLQLVLHNICNFACRYCFREPNNAKKCKYMTVATAVDAIQYFVRCFAHKESNIVVDLTGSGEPLLDIPFIERISFYCKRLEHKIGRKVRVSLCTNGSLLSKDLISYFENNNISFGVSLDGGQAIQDSLRPSRQGAGTYYTVINNLQYAKGSSSFIGLYGTLTGKYYNVESIYNDLYDLGVTNSISVTPVRLPSTHEYAITYESAVNIKAAYSSLFGYAIEEAFSGHAGLLKCLCQSTDIVGEYFRCVLFRKRSTRPCGAGLANIAIDGSGDIYACANSKDCASFCIGNIYNGIVAQLRKRYITPSIYTNLSCQRCWARNICGGECYVRAQMVDGSIYTPSRDICELRKHIIKLCIDTVQLLRSHRPQLLSNSVRN